MSIFLSFDIFSFVFGLVLGVVGTCLVMYILSLRAAYRDTLPLSAEHAMRLSNERRAEACKQAQLEADLLELETLREWKRRINNENARQRIVEAE